MTSKVRRDSYILIPSRQGRIAASSGMRNQDVNRLIKRSRGAQKIGEMFQKTGEKGLGSSLARY